MSELLAEFPFGGSTTSRESFYGQGTSPGVTSALGFTASPCGETVCGKNYLWKQSPAESADLPSGVG